MGLGPIHDLAGIFTLVAAAASSSRGGAGGPGINGEAWKVSIRGAISSINVAEHQKFGIVDIWVYFHPREGNVLGVSVGNNNVPEGLPPNVAGLVRIHYHPDTGVLMVDRTIRVYSKGEASAVDTGR